MRNLIAAMLTFASGAALAQETPPPATEAAPTQSTDERVTETEGKVTSIEEQLAEIKSILSPLSKLKFSGYVQGRYQWEQTRENGTGGFSRFTVRRSRLKATYTGDIAQFMLQIDASPSGVTLKDAEATLFIPGTKQNQSVTLGQMKWPFGYEAVQSSSDREFPERTRVIRAFLPDERDRGVKYSGKFGFLRLSAGVFDGNGINFPNSAGVDNDKEKDLIGRAGFDLKWISGGISGWYGHTIPLVKAVEDPYRLAYERSRIGADLQVYLDFLPVGATALKGEYIKGKTFVSNGTELLDRPASGWYALLVQNIGVTDAVAVRYDYFDPSNGTPALADSKNPTAPAGTNAVGTVGLTAIHYFGENLKLSATYEHPMTAVVADVHDPHDDQFTVQMQARF
ncbi:porin [Vitiosangium sp. GDMCC 1.1324]|uniref:porin n=1 Tax=Vitiosangium sp. (strain GDMCC 1.1324) TaxID=2138576 RepID=UPI000D384905|nr:porin [Vitiosangium sp. GDMCC 1.1324]PTL82440.1 porin [Vitiosangium sp. GDMCC 1.1324]